MLNINVQITYLFFLARAEGFLVFHDLFCLLQLRKFSNIDRLASQFEME